MCGKGQTKTAGRKRETIATVIHEQGPELSEPALNTVEYNL
jgi:hypothetical protein